MREAGGVNMTGGPVGCVIVMDGQVIGAAANSVMRNHDPFAHDEVKAIRQVCALLQTVDLTGAMKYTSCECCPIS
ncbi:deaminase [Cyanobium sp. Morenito 9A2]|uniref:deaminase n=1 Tax=Cyanobium sp. Morenito 9A2 TaxID=2823718 RepID=UPI0020CD252B|nr:deaminase [Cyanobium sp. Morenito 9A2]